MKPLGTISMCFPHVDGETRSILQSVMDEAENYADFTEQLCNKACSEKVPPILQYFAFFHAWNLDMYPQMERLYNLDEIPICIEPLYLSSRVVLGYEVDMNTMYKSLVKAMETIPNDWLACHLYLAWRRVAETFDPETDTDLQTMETLRDRIENDKDFECFQSYSKGFEGYAMYLKGYRTEAVNLYKKGIAIARKYDDLALVADGLYMLAESVKRENPSYAIDLMLEQKKIGEELGYAWALARYSLVFGRIMTLRGEYDAALSHYLDYQEATSSQGHPDVLLNYSLILVYNLVDQGKNALDYLEKARGRIDGRKRHMALYHMQLAFALMNIGDEIKAYKQLDAAKHLAVQSGIQGYMDVHQYLEGFFEKESGDFQSATATLESLLLRLGEESNLYKNLSFFHLADIEVETYSSHQVELSESWLHRFETYVEENDYPGFVAQAKILKARLFQKQGEHKKAQALVDEVLQVAETPSMMYLKEMISTHVPGISRSSS